jgi:hypothetical protein
MKRRDWLVSAAVALICGVILVIFTDIEFILRRAQDCPSGGSEPLPAHCR